MKNEIAKLTKEILADYNGNRTVDKVELFDQPDRLVVKDILKKLLKVIFPGFFRDQDYRFYNMNSKLTVLIEDIVYNLTKQITIALQQSEKYAALEDEEAEKVAQEITLKFVKQIPKVRALVDSDVQAAFDGDPAAYNKNEIILCYPGLLAISISRLAHELYVLQVPLIPRMMTEYAHSKTGIDIHPGATVGERFCIDHGTGIVVGETTVIGKNVKIYQGVTLGALSTRGGQRLKNVRRHPTIEDNVTIYSGASVLGGDTVIGEGSVIGSNAFITKSVAPGTKVSIKNQEMVYKNGNGQEDKARTEDFGF